MALPRGQGDKPSALAFIIHDLASRLWEAKPSDAPF
jgi:hypothetical protein